MKGEIPFGYLLAIILSGYWFFMYNPYLLQKDFVIVNLALMANLPKITKIIVDKELIQLEIEMVNLEIRRLCGAK